MNHLENRSAVPQTPEEMLSENLKYTDDYDANFPVFKLQKDNKFDALTAKRQELISVLKKLVDVKRNIENGAEDRLTDFVNRKIPLEKLYIYDLTQMQNSDIYLKHRKALEKYRRKVFSRLLDDEGTQYKPIEELHLKRKK